MSKIESSKALKVSEDIVITLDHPIEWGQETITEVVLKPLTGRHVRGISATPTLDDLLKVAAKASGLSDKVFDRMRAKDIQKVVEAVGEGF